MICPDCPGELRDPYLDDKGNMLTSCMQCAHIYSLDLPSRRPKRDRPLDQNTFGNSDAAHYLVDLLNETDDQRVVSRARSFMTRYISMLSCIVVPSVYAKSIARLVRLDAKKVIDEHLAFERLPKLIADLMMNVITARIRMILNDKHTSKVKYYQRLAVKLPPDEDGAVYAPDGAMIGRYDMDNKFHHVFVRTR